MKSTRRAQVKRRAPLAAGLVLVAGACGGDPVSFVREAQRHLGSTEGTPPSAGSDRGGATTPGGSGQAGGGGGIAGGGDGGTAGSSSAEDATMVDAEILTRWNEIADQQASTFDFHWSEVDQFPHPTYKGGTAEAYRAFAEVLVAFFAAGDNFDFLSAHHRFDVSLRYVFPSGQNGLDTSFRGLATSFASPASFGDIPPATRTRLQGFADRMGP
jgi:hypothetical protein